MTKCSVALQVAVVGMLSLIVGPPAAADALSDSLVLVIGSQSFFVPLQFESQETGKPFELIFSPPQIEIDEPGTKVFSDFLTVTADVTITSDAGKDGTDKGEFTSFSFKILSDAKGQDDALCAFGLQPPNCDAFQSTLGEGGIVKKIVSDDLLEPSSTADSDLIGVHMTFVLVSDSSDSRGSDPGEVIPVNLIILSDVAPEPSTLLLFGSGLGVFLGLTRRRMRRG